MDDPLSVAVQHMLLARYPWLFAYPTRPPFEGERSFFARQPGVAGMAAFEDGAVTLNPYRVDPLGQASVRTNEAARLYLRDYGVSPPPATPAQQARFKGTAYGGNPAALRETLVTRALAGDPSAGPLSADQAAFVARLRSRLKPEGW